MSGYPHRSTKVLGVGKSYRHNWPDLKPTDPLPEPMIFIKPPTSLIHSNEIIRVPRGCTCLHEVEIAVIIGKAGRNLKVVDASDHIAGYALALDLAVGNVLAEAKANGTPWDVAKGIDSFTPIGRFIPSGQLTDPHNVDLTFTVDGKVEQFGSSRDLIYSFSQLVAYLSGIFTLEPGDIILTGTPPGQGSILPGSIVRAEMHSAKGELLDRMEFPVQIREKGYQKQRHWLDELE